MISMVRPDSLEQRSARRGVCPRAPSRAAAAAAVTHPAARPGFSLTGFLFCFLLASCGVHGISPQGAGEQVAWGLPGCAFVSDPGAGAGVRLCGKRPGRSPARRAGPAAGVRERGAGGGPAAAQPPPPAGQGGARAAQP